MALKKTTALYEMLIRFGPDGYIGAHVIDAETVTDGGEVIAHKSLPARPVTKSELGSLLGANNAKLIEAADAARAERDQAREAEGAARVAAEKAETARSQLEAQHANALSRLDDRAAEINALKVERDQARAAAPA